MPCWQIRRNCISYTAATAAAPWLQVLQLTSAARHEALRLDAFSANQAQSRTMQKHAKATNTCATSYIESQKHSNTIWHCLGWTLTWRKDFKHTWSTLVKIPPGQNKQQASLQLTLTHINSFYSPRSLGTDDVGLAFSVFGLHELNSIHTSVHCVGASHREAKDERRIFDMVRSSLYQASKRYYIIYSYDDNLQKILYNILIWW